MISRRLLQTISVLFLLGWFIQPPTAHAHGYIVRAIPEDRAVLERAPTRVQYWFSEALEPTFSGLNVRNQRGEIVATGGVADEDRALLRAQLPPDLPDGAYIVELRPAFASDGHVIVESRVFFVGAEVAGVAGGSGTVHAIPLEVLWRALTYSASMLLFGVFTLYAGVLVPAWGSKDYPAGLLPPRVMRRLYLLIGVGLALAFVGNGIALIQQTQALFGVALVDAFQPSLWEVVRIGSRFGDVWNARLFFLGLVGLMFLAALYFQREQPATVRAFLTASAWVMSLVLGSFSVASHAAGSPILPWVGVTFDWFHMVGVGFWLGGIMALVLVAPVALEPYTGETRRLALLAVLSRFSRWAMAALAVVVTTGIYSASTWIDSPQTAATTFGASLAFKLLLVGLLIAVGAAHHIALRPQRYARWGGVIRRVGDFSGTLRLEFALALAALSAAGLLTATPIPVPADVENTTPPPSDVRTVNGFSAALTITPGGPGVNTYDALITTADGAPVEDGITVEFQNVYPNAERRSAWQVGEQIDAGLFVTANDDIDRPGAWWTLVDITTDHGQQTRIAFEWDITQDAAVSLTRPPSLINLLAIALTLAAIGWAIYPTFRRYYDMLNLTPTNVVIALWATGGTAIFMVAGFFIISETQRNYELTLNPPPAVVNTVLPSAESLARGAALFGEWCAGWDGDAIEELRQRLPRTRDEELFAFTRDGWRRLPACGGELTDAQRWDMVNYVRTLR